jgi:hypothetical protein
MAGLMIATLAGSVGAAHAAVNVNIGINVPAPPHLVAVPGTPVQYAPTVAGNYFFYGGRYYVFSNGNWYQGPGYNGPWVVVAPAYVPRPLLTVPVRYYHTTPAEWRRWRREQPPQWAHNWGRDWDEHGHPNRGHDRDHDDHRH